jgi:hypothetical protein
LVGVGCGEGTQAVNIAVILIITVFFKKLIISNYAIELYKVCLIIKNYDTI